MTTSRRLLSCPSRSSAALLAAALSSSLPRTDDGSAGHKVRCIRRTSHGFTVPAATGLQQSPPVRLQQACFGGEKPVRSSTKL